MVAAVLCLALTGGSLQAADPQPPGPRDRCPVCGMFVARHPDWVAVIVLDDGRRASFDGPKDMFKYLLDPGRYGAEGEVEQEIEEGEVAVWVTDYYTTRMIDAGSALFVLGSDVVGPMGAELVPISSEEEASHFVADHGGDRVLTFDRLTPDDIPTWP